MTRKMKLAIVTIAALATMAVAFPSTSPAPMKTWYTTVSLVAARVAEYDFGYDSVTNQQIGKVPAIVQIHTFNLHRGAAIPWHYHKAVSYVAIQGGTVTEQHLNSDGSCSSPQEFTAGGGFTEPPEYIHTVVNVGNTDALITWATAYPASDAPLKISPQFTVGGLYPVAPPSCN
jgi:quercetin dioxygenase-like cupin family protein